jgi:LPS O-antigen subunit length determinant protein (WzzB/FepE family)
MTTASDARARNIFSSVWSNRFIISAMVQGAVITGLTLAFVAAQILTSGTNIIIFLCIHDTKYR